MDPFGKECDSVVHGCLDGAHGGQLEPPSILRRLQQHGQAHSPALYLRRQIPLQPAVLVPNVVATSRRIYRVLQQAGLQ